MSAATDITNRTNEAAITLLCTFNESVSTRAGAITYHPPFSGPPDDLPGEFILATNDGKRRPFTTASGAVEVLRRMSR